MADRASVILTPDQRLRVFVSSTLQELADERAAARQAIAQLRLAPVMFELGARPHPPRDLYRAYLDQSHIFIGIYWQKYGWVAPGETLSELEDEYRLSGDRPKLIYVKTPASDRELRLSELLDRIRDDDRVSYKAFTTAGELRELIENDLAMVLGERFEHAQAALRPTPEHLTPGPAHRSNIPHPPTPLVGRERELGIVKGMLARNDVSLLTLTGPGGTGKTRLALQAARELAADYEDGVTFVELAAISDASLVASAIAQALDIHEERGGRSILDGLKEHLRSRHKLLVLDNFEQVVMAGLLVVELLERSPRLKMLVTSRAPLRVRGEKELPVMPLDVPERQAALDAGRLTQYAAVELFIQRAQAVRPGFAVTNENAPAVAEICYRLDGLPLAIELAAARIKVLSPQALLARLERALEVLRGGLRDLPARQQTLSSAIEWSYNLLGEGAQTLFRRLSAFVGGWTLEAAEAVCNADGDLDVDVLDEMGALVDNSLLKRAPEASAGGETRFGMLATIREYARERLVESDEEDRLRQRHAAFFRRLAEEAEPHLTSGERAAWLARLEAEHDNLRAALAWCRTEKGDAETGLRVASALGWFWFFRGYLSEGRAWLKEMLAKAGDAERAADAQRANALSSAGGLAWAQGDYAAARAWLEKSIAICRELLPSSTHLTAQPLDRFARPTRPPDHPTTRPPDHSTAFARPLDHSTTSILARSLAMLGFVSVNEGNHQAARALHEESLSLSRRVGGKWLEAITLSNLGDATLMSGDLAKARSLYEQSLSIFQQVGDAWGRAIALYALGSMMLFQGDDVAARSSFEESVALSRSAGDKWNVARALLGVAGAVWYQGDAARAKALYEESLTLAHAVGNAASIIMALAGLAGTSTATGEPDRAARLAGLVDVLCRTVGARLWHTLRPVYDRSIASARAQMYEARPGAWAKLYAEGQAMTMEQAIRYALEAPGAHHAYEPKP